MNTKYLLAKTVIYLLLSVPFVSFRITAKAQSIDVKSDIQRKGTAIIITGAAARIPQEAALLEQLYNSGSLKDVSFISGASSGALNTTVLNAILSNKLSWNQYKNILFSVTNRQVFTRNGSALPLDTRPLRELLRRIVNDSLGFYKIGDLPFASAISATNAQIKPLDGRTYRFSNRKINAESNPDYDLTDILMASAAIPRVFPSVKLNIPDSTHKIKFIDGGVAEDHIPFEAARQYAQLTGIQFEKMIIVSRKNNPATDISLELNDLGIKDTKVRERLAASIEHLSKEGFIKKLILLKETDPELAGRTYVYVPDFAQDFQLLDFNNFKVQYKVSSAWAVSHQPIPLEQYISENVNVK